MASKRWEIQLSCVLIEPKSDKSADLNVWGYTILPWPIANGSMFIVSSVLKKDKKQPVKNEMYIV
jgi:uncharacterized protein affecting Mg2+/Co2+ transport